MSGSQCLSCGAKFDSFIELANHLKSHSKARRDDYKVSSEVVEEVEKIKETSKIEEKPLVQPTISSPPPKVSTPICLSYKFSGQCPVCFIEVETICIKTDLGSYIVAWCPREKKELQQRQVVPIEEMDKVFKSKYLMDKSEDLAVAENYPINKNKR